MDYIFVHIVVVIFNVENLTSYRAPVNYQVSFLIHYHRPSQWPLFSIMFVKGKNLQKRV